MSKVRKLHKSKEQLQPKTYLQWCKRLGVTVIDFPLQKWNAGDWAGMLQTLPVTKEPSLTHHIGRVSSTTIFIYEPLN